MKQDLLVVISVFILAWALVSGSFPVWSQIRSGGAPQRPSEQELTQVPKQPRGSQAGEEIRRAQEALKAKGHYHGPINGVMEDETREALRTFQASRGLKATGVLDEETKKALGIDRGDPSKSEGGPPAPAKKTAPQEHTSHMQG